MKYTKSAFLDTVDFIKKIVYSSDLIIQISYICYIVYRLVQQIGILVTNIILLCVSFVYLIYHLVTTREFYTPEQNENKKSVKLIVKIIKRLVNIVVIGISIYQLTIRTEISNLDILLTLMLVLGFMVAVLGDIIVKIINSKISLILNALKYDLSIMREEHPLVASKPINLIDEKIGLSVDSNMIKEIKDANHRQEMKNRRKKAFLKKNSK